MTWLHLAAFSGSDHATPVQDLILRARLVSVAMALLTVAGVYWAGLSIGGVMTGLFAALVCASNPVLIGYGRMASDPIYHGGWVLISIAAAVWAIRPTRPAISLLRQALGWGLCGFTLGIAILTAGPSALLGVGLPVLLILCLCPHRINHAMGLIAALLIGCLVALPWAGYIHGWDPDIWRYWLNEALPASGWDWAALIRTVGQRCVWALLAMLPWTVWLVGAIVQPFSASSTGLRSQLFVGWVWLITTLAMWLVLFRVQHIGDMLILVPPFAVFTGQLFNQYTQLASEGHPPRFWRWLRWPHLTLLGIASIAIPAAWAAQPWLIQRGSLTQPVTNPVYWPIAAGLGITLLLLVAFSAHWSIRNRPRRALVAWSVWMLILAWATILPLAHGPTRDNPIRQEAQRIATLTAQHPIYSLMATDDPAPQLDPVLLLYAGRPIPPISTQQLQLIAQEHGVFFLLHPAGQPQPLPGLKNIIHLPQAQLDLWQAKP